MTLLNNSAMVFVGIALLTMNLLLTYQIAAILTSNLGKEKSIIGDIIFLVSSIAILIIAMVAFLIYGLY